MTTPLIAARNMMTGTEARKLGIADQLPAAGWVYKRVRLGHGNAAPVSWRWVKDGLPGAPATIAALHRARDAAYEAFRLSAGLLDAGDLNPIHASIAAAKAKVVAVATTEDPDATDCYEDSRIES